ncbi:MAG: lipid-A-disaccharide synthase [Bacteroidota bacterium]|nr:lipid-A-disaccharide synthase [Bacteroidota bacterium]
MKLYIIAGEASGDLHGAALIRQLKQKQPDISIKAWGGDKMKAEGADIDFHYENASFMGFVEVLRNLWYILKLFRLTKSSILAWKPDALLLIDYPGFNLRMAAWAKSKNIPVYYYISPQVWAWKEKRVEIIKLCVKKMFVILPFEKEFYKKHSYPVIFEGHPLINNISQFKFNPKFRSNNQIDSRSIIALLPGSRAQEIKTKLPIFLNALKNENKYNVVIAGLEHNKAIYNSLVKDIRPGTHIVYDNTYQLLHQSFLAIVTSGTATLETALFNVPQVVCYKGNSISYEIAKRLIKLSYISLVNLILHKNVITELIQYELTDDNLQTEIRRLKDPIIRTKIKLNYQELQTVLGDGRTSEKIADHLIQDFASLKLL